MVSTYFCLVLTSTDLQLSVPDSVTCISDIRDIMVIFIALKEGRLLHLCWVLGARQGFIFGRVCRSPTGNDSSGVVHRYGRIRGQIDPMQPPGQDGCWTLKEYAAGSVATDGSLLLDVSASLVRWSGCSLVRGF